MPLALNPADRKLLLVSGGIFLAIVVALAALSSGQDKGEGTPSSYSALRRGGKAAYLLLKQSGYDIARWERPPQQLPEKADKTLLIIAEPELHADREESIALQKFVASGGTLLLAGGNLLGLVPGLHTTWGRYRAGWEQADAVAPTPLTRGGPISMDQGMEWDGDDYSAIAHYAQNGKAVVVSYRIGKGEVIWWASALPLTNAGLRDRHNLALLLNSVGEGNHILWDEYFHGEGKRASLGFTGVVLGWGAAQFGALALVLLFTFGRRSGPLLPLARDPRLSPLEFVETLGGLYHRAGARQAALEIAGNRFRQMVARRLGVHEQLRAAEIVRAMEAHGLAVPTDFAQRLMECEDAIGDPDLSSARALRLARFLSDAAQALRSGSNVTQESSHGSDSATAVAGAGRTEESHRRAAGVH